MPTATKSLTKLFNNDSKLIIYKGRVITGWMLSSCMAFAERLSRFYEEAEAFKVFLAQLKRINEINFVMSRLKSIESFSIFL